jgi:alpha-1,2-mannosyltransferase
MIDLQVYRMGGEALLHHKDLYSAILPGTNLAFTYPVFSAVIFIPYALMPLLLAKIVSLVVSLLALWVLVHLTVRYAAPHENALRWSVPMTLVAATAHPVLDTLMFGQVNLWTTALVLADLLLIRDRRWRGALIGVATGVKLVSGLFIVHLLVTRQFRAALNATLGFVGTVAIGFAVRPGGSIDYWTRHMFDADRVGGIAYVTNQSILGVDSRLLRDPHPPSALTLSLSAAVAVASLVIARRWHSRQDEFAAACIVATGSLLASPISWSHHWVWMVPALGVVVVWARERGGWWRWGVVGSGAAILWVGAMRFLPKTELRELHHTLTQEIVANAYAALALAFLVWAALPGRRGQSGVALPRQRGTEELLSSGEIPQSAG